MSPNPAKIRQSSPNRRSTTPRCGPISTMRSPSIRTWAVITLSGLTRRPSISMTLSLFSRGLAASAAKRHVASAGRSEYAAEPKTQVALSCADRQIRLASPLPPRGSSSMELKQAGPWEIDKKLGAGGMGTVYLGKHTQTGQVAAIKVLPASLAREEGFIERFKREIVSMEKLKSPHI